MNIIRSILLLATMVYSCSYNNSTTSTTMIQNDTTEQLAVATLGTGCFWCTEAQFEQLQGVIKVESGYSGGALANPTYKQVCSGNTGHAEVIQLHYNPKEISYEKLLEAFFLAHDPTTLNRQGADVGTQYRSVIFYHNEEQKKLATYYKQRLNEEQAYAHPVVTEIAPFTAFYKAENYHQNYYQRNKNEPYCMMVIQPKLQHFRKAFASQLKP